MTGLPPEGGAPAPLSLWVVPVPDLGGVARHVLDVAATGLPGLRLVVLCPEGPLAARLREQGSAVVTGPFGPDSGMAASVRTLRRMVRTLRPAVVHSHLAYADLVCAAVLRGPTGPRTAHGKDRPRGPVLVSTEHGIAGDPGIYHRDPVTARWRERLHTRRLRRTSPLRSSRSAIRTTVEGLTSRSAASWAPASGPGCRRSSIRYCGNVTTSSIGASERAAIRTRVRLASSTAWTSMSVGAPGCSGGIGLTRTGCHPPDRSETPMQ